MATENIDIDYTKYDFKDSTEMYVHLSKKGLSKETVIEISKINISDISKELGVPKESVRRKVLELEKQKIIKRTGKKIFVVRDTLYSAKAVETLTEIATLLHEFSKVLKKIIKYSLQSIVYNKI